MTGAQDILFYRGAPLRNAFALAYPRVTFESIEDAGHYSMLETPVRARASSKQVAATG